MLRGQSVENHKARIMAGKCVFRANITEPNDQKFHNVSR